MAYPGCDVDPQNRLERATPLHLAAKISDADLRVQVVESLVEAGADTKCVTSSSRTNIFIIHYRIIFQDQR